jgi:16S rRNA (cytosine967-C5)-methyltransferase
VTETDPPGTEARRAALKLLIAVLWQGRALESVQGGTLGGLRNPADRGLARQVAGHVLRWLPDLDALIDSATPNPLPDDARARMVLRMALAQALCMQTPHHAAVATALPLVERGPRQLVHAVLGRLLREGATLPEVPTLPEGFGERWAEAWGPAVATAAARAIREEPATDLTLRDAGETERWAEALEAAVVAPGRLRVSRHGTVTEWPGFREGAWWVQDLAASLPATLLGPVKDRAVFDICAAPGGKTLQLAAAGAKVVAVDVSAKRLERLAENLQRMRLQAKTVAADALAFTPKTAVDDVLLDAPCSASGIFRRHPDVLHLKGGRDLTPLLDIQARLLGRAAQWLPAHGRLIYCVCSLEREEGEAQIEDFLARTPGFAIDPVAAQELPAGLTPASEGWLRTLPGDLEAQGGLDGFFIARIRRT